MYMHVHMQYASLLLQNVFSLTTECVLLLQQSYLSRHVAVGSHERELLLGAHQRLRDLLVLLLLLEVFGLHGFKARYSLIGIRVCLLL